MMSRMIERMMPLMRMTRKPDLCRLAAGCVAAAVLAAAAPMHGQSGDKTGEKQMLRVPPNRIPPAPVLLPEQSLGAFRLDPAFRIEVVAHEPMVENPVAIAFDTAGRLWVVEMRGFMPNVDGRGERDIPGRVVVLHDDDGDGRMDRRTVFLDDLVMPRAIAMAGDGVLVGEPPHLWFCRDTNGDDVCDEKTALATDYGDQKNPEHTANGLVRALDNWYYNLYHPHRYRLAGAVWERQPMPNRVQWGMSQDNFGRLYFTSNSDQLRADLIPAHYAAGRPGIKLSGLNSQVTRDQTVWPARVNPGVNRGYQSGTLRPDGTLARFTAACGTTIYRGGLFPPEFEGNAFVCEPSANLIRRNVLTERDGNVTARNAHDRSEFLTSTDERFRPVNLATGPEGALYVVDMYQGILQHRIYLTTYLRNQALSRGLDGPPFLGRIYRVMPNRGAPPRKVSLAGSDSRELVGRLGDRNGWVRDTAQRLLVERNDAGVVEALRGRASADGRDSVPRLHALWVLEGMGRVDMATLGAALEAEEGQIRAAGLRLAEPFLTRRDGDLDAEIMGLRAKVFGLAEEDCVVTRRQLALTLGTVPHDPEVREVLLALKKGGASSVRDAAAFSLALHEPKAAEPSQSVQAKTPTARRLTAEEQARFEAGREVYELTCIACHQGHGLGQEGLAPPLVDSEWIGISAGRLARIVLQGMRGPITVKGATYEIDMPSLAVLDDQQIADVLTFIRREWGHAYDPIGAEEVRKARAETADREDAWTAAELMEVR